MTTENTGVVSTPAPQAPMFGMGDVPSMDAAPAPTESAGAPPAPATQAPVDAPKEDGLGLAKKFNALTKRERQLLEREQALKSREERLAPFEKLVGNATVNPEEFLRAGNLTYKDLTDFYLKGGKVPEPGPEEKVTSEVESLKKTLEEMRQELQQKEARQAINAFHSDLTQFVKQNTEKYELISAMDPGCDRVLHEIMTAQRATGVVATFEEACDYVEAALEAEATERLESLRKVKRFSARFRDETAPPPGSPQGHQQRGPESNPFGPTHATQMRPMTLTARAHSAQTHPHAERYLSNEESIAEAAKLLRFTP